MTPTALLEMFTPGGPVTSRMVGRFLLLRTCTVRSAKLTGSVRVG